MIDSMDEGRDSAMVGKIPPVAGMSLCWTATFLFFYSETFVPSEVFSPLEKDASRLCYLVGIVLGQLIFLRRFQGIMPNADKRSLALLGSGLLLVSVAAQMTGVAYGAPALPLAAFMLLAGVWQGISHVLWGEVGSSESPEEGLRGSCASVAVGAAAFTVASLFPRWLVVVALMICCCLSTVLYCLAQDGEGQNAIEVAGSLPSSDFRKCDIVCAVYGAVLGTSIYACLLFEMPFGATDLVIGIALAFGAGIVLVLSRAHKLPSFTKAATVLLPVVSVALVLLVVVPEQVAWSIYALLLAVLTFFDILNFGFFSRVASAFGIPRCRCMARGRIAVQLGMAVAYFANAMIADVFGASGRISFFVPLALIVALSAMAAVGGGIEISLGQEKPLAFGPQVEGDLPMDDFMRDINQEKCEAVAGKYGLSNRELEVLLLLTSGYNVKGIADKLVISANTVKTHVSHIYRKMGVKSRQGVIDVRDSMKEN